jgi:hypothetical protein
VWTEHALPLDLLLYVSCFGYALAVALTNQFYGFRVWGNFAAAGYGLAALHTAWLLYDRRRPGAGRTGRLRSRWVGVGVVGVVGMVLPLATLVVRRLTGRDWLDTPFSWSAQPEVWVIERSARLLLDTGTPYVDIAALPRSPVVNDYTPYGPTMPLLGLPRALFGGSPLGDALTDARLVFALVAAACVWGALRVLGHPRVPVLSAQLSVIFPLTALTFATAGPDLAMLGPIVLATALAARDRPIAAAAVLALVVSAKLITLPSAVVLAVLVLARLGARTFGTFLLVFTAGCAVLNVPVFLVDPGAFVEHVVRFPAGLGAVTSPAASPLPGHLIAATGPVGKVIAFVLLAVAGLAVLAWLVRRPPVTGSDALLRVAVGLAAFTLLTTATRFGYLVYPVALLGASVCFRAAETQDADGNEVTSS